MPKIPVTFDDVKTLAERSKTKTLGDSDLFAVEIAQEIKGLTKEDALETLGINDLDGRVQYLEETALNNKADKDTDAVVGNFAYFDAEGNPVDSGKKDADYEDADATILKEADVVDSLESTSTTAPLSANQGKVLNDAIGEVEGRVEDAEDDITAIKGVGYTEGTLKSHEDRLGTLEGADTIEGSVAKTVKDAVDPIIEDVSDHETRLDTLEADSATEVLKNIKDNAKDATYDNSTSGLTAETLGGAIDEVEGRVDTVEGEIDDLQTAETDIKGNGWTDENLVDHESRITQNESDIVALKGTGWTTETVKQNADDIATKESIENVNTLKGAGWTDETVKGNAEDIATLNGDDTTEGSVLKSIKDNAEDATFTPTPKSGITSVVLKDAVNEVGGRLGSADNAIIAIKGIGWTNENLVDHGDRLDTLEAFSVKDVVVIGSASQVSAGLAGESWEEITADNEAWIFFWVTVHLSEASVRFLRGEYEIPTNIYFGENGDGRFAIPCGVAKIEGAGEDTVIKVGYPAGGTAFLSATKHDGYNHAPCHISNLKIVNTGTTTFGVVTEVEGSSGSVVENVIVEDMIAVGILASWDVKNVTFRNCTTINCGSAFAEEQAAGIAVLAVDNCTPSNIKIDGCTVIGGAYAGIGIVNAIDCKVVNCHVEDYGKIGAGAIGGERNIFANNTIIRDTQADPQAGEFGILLNETDRAIVTGNIVENGHIMDNNSNDCLVENNIGDVL